MQWALTISNIVTTSEIFHMCTILAESLSMEKKRIVSHHFLKLLHQKYEYKSTVTTVIQQKKEKS